MKDQDHRRWLASVRRLQVWKNHSRIETMNTEREREIEASQKQQQLVSALVSCTEALATAIDVLDRLSQSVHNVHRMASYNAQTAIQVLNGPLAVARHTIEAFKKTNP